MAFLAQIMQHITFIISIHVMMADDSDVPHLTTHPW